MIEYRTTPDGVTTEHLFGGFFEGWPNPPAPETHLQLLRQSGYVVIAADSATGQVVGFITAISDGSLAAYIPFLEVLAGYRSAGIGRELVTRMLELLSGYYMIDLSCDAELQSWYEGLGMRRATGMMIRNYEHQSGRRAFERGAG